MAVESRNLIVVAINSYGSGTNNVLSISDTAGNSFRRAGAAHALDGYSGIQHLYYAYNAAASVDDVVTVTMSESGTYLDVVMAQYSGVLDTSDPLDVTARGQATSAASVTSSSFTPSQANSLAVALVSVDWGGGAPTSLAAGDGYSVRQTIRTSHIYEDRIDAPASAQTASGSESGAVAPFQIGIITAVFKPN